MRRIQNNTHQNSTDNRRDRQSNKPPKITPPNHPPINTFITPITQSNRHRGPDNTLRRTNRQSQSTRKNDGKRRAEFHTESPRGGLKSKTVAEIAHHVVAVRSETDDDTCASEGEDPDWDGESGAAGAGFPDLVDCC